jgi:hypothetical protein
MLRAVDWCELELHERTENLGLGRSILTGVTEALNRHQAVIVFEDDLICVAGTYKYLTAALERYRDDPRVFSVTGWTHPRVTPSDIGEQPYFDGRAECWSWGTWGRAWQGMDRPAMELLRACRARGIDPAHYGYDLPQTAAAELRMNVWAVRFLYLHIMNKALCLRPARSLVDHIGWGAGATNASAASDWANPPLQPCPPIPDRWPEPVEAPACAGLWTCAYPSPPRVSLLRHLRIFLGRIRHRLLAPGAGHR